MPLFRAIGLLSGISIPLFYWLNPKDSFDPFWIRVVLSAFCLSIFVGSFLSKWVADQIKLLAYGAVVLITGWIVWLTVNNNFHPTYTLSLTIILFAGSLLLESVRGLVVYSAAVVLLVIAGTCCIDSPPPDFGFFIAAIFLVTGLGLLSQFLRIGINRQKDLNQNFMKSIYLETPDAQLLVTPGTGTITDCNYGTMSLLELSHRTALVGEKIHAVLPGLFSGMRLQEVENSIQARGEVRREVALTTMMGREIWADVVVRSVHIDGETLWLVRITDNTATRKVLQESRHLSELSTQITSVNDITEALRISVNKFLLISGWTYGEGWLKVPGKKEYKLVTWNDSGNYRVRDFLEMSKNHVIQEGKGIGGLVLRSGRPMWLKDLQTEPAFQRKEQAARAGLNTLMVAPVMSGDELIAMVTMFHSSPSDDDFRLFTIFCGLSAQLGTQIRHRQAEAQLKLADERNRILNEATFQGVAVYKEGKIIEANAVFCSLFGYSPTSILGLRVRDLVAEESLPLVLAHQNQPLTEPYEVVSKRRDGSTFWSEVVARNQTLPDGEVRIVSIRDISHLKKIMDSAAAESEERFRSLFEQSPDAIFVEDENGIVLDGNRAAHELHGLTHTELIGKNVADLVPAEMRTEVKEMFHKWFTGEITYWEGNSLTASGKVIPVEIRAQRVSYNQHPAVIFQVRDISRRVESQKRLEVSREKLSLHNRKLKELASTVNFNSVDLDTALEQILKTAALTLGVERSSLWLFNESRTAIVCRKLFVKETNQFSGGIELRESDFPAYFHAMREERVINASHARTDKATAEFTSSYLIPLDIYSMLDVPVRFNGEMAGVLCNEAVGAMHEFSVEDEVFAGTVGDLISMAMEVASRVQVEKSLAQSLSTLQATYESTVDGIIVVDNAGRLLSYNKVFREMWGFADSDLGDEGKNFAYDEALTKVKDPAAFNLTVMQMREQPREKSYDLIQFNDGRILERYSRPLVNGDEVIGRLWFFHDITRRVRIEAALRKSERRFKSILDAIPDMMLRITADGKVLDVKVGSLGHLFENAHNLQGRNIKAIFHEQLAERLSSLIEEAIRDGEPRVHEFDIRIKGELLDLEARLVRSGKSEVLAMVRDVTQRKKSERELIKRNFELDSFVYRASHDLKSPLNSLQGLITLIQEKELDAESAQFISLMDRSVSKLDNFIRDLADFSRNTRMDVIRTRIDFRQLVQESEENLRFMENAQRLDKRFVLEEEGEFFSDPVRLGIIFNNLLSNAVKYQDLHKSQNWVSIQIHVSAQQAVVRVEDNGIGIEAQHLDKIFNLFFRASIQSHGTGLGLYIVKNAVEKIKGRIHVESAPGAGTTLTLTLPNLAQVDGSDTSE